MGRYHPTIQRITISDWKRPVKKDKLIKWLSLLVAGWLLCTGDCIYIFPALARLKWVWPFLFIISYCAHEDAPLLYFLFENDIDSNAQVTAWVTCKNECNRLWTQLPGKGNRSSPLSYFSNNWWMQRCKPEFCQFRGLIFSNFCY